MTGIDNSLQIIQKHAKQDKRIQVFQNKNKQTITIYCNILMHKAKTEFIVWVDAR